MHENPGTAGLFRGRGKNFRGLESRTVAGIIQACTAGRAFRVGAHSGAGTMTSNHRLWRSQDHRMIAGVCGGIAEFFGWTPTAVRVLYVLVSICSAAFPGILAYVILWFVMPKQLPAPIASTRNGDPAIS